MRVVIADCNPASRRALRDLLQASEDFVVPGEASTLRESIELCRYYTPDAVVLETDVAEASDDDAVQAIHDAAPSVRILVRSHDERPEAQLDALSGGASGFIPKSAPINGVVPALEAVARGEASVPRETTTYLIERLRRLSSAAFGMRPIDSPLTEREWEVLDLLSQRRDTHAIAAALGLTQETVYSHVKSVLRKLGVHSRDEAIATAELMRDPFGCSATTRRRGSRPVSASDMRWGPQGSP